jgi:hypothetical protein
MHSINISRTTVQHMCNWKSIQILTVCLISKGLLFFYTPCIGSRNKPLYASFAGRNHLKEMKNIPAFLVLRPFLWRLAIHTITKSDTTHFGRYQYSYWYFTLINDDVTTLKNNDVIKFNKSDRELITNLMCLIQIQSRAPRWKCEFM